MKNITVIVPTRNRYSKLMTMIRSIPNIGNIDIHVVCDNDRETYEKLNDLNINKIKVSLTDSHCGSVYCRNLASNTVKDGLLYATDDIIFSSGAIEQALKTFNLKFKDDDGVVGFNQLGDSKFHVTGVALVGQKFLLRYPNKHLFFPGYFHFCCQEVHILSSLFNKFVFDDRATLIHKHPGKFRKLMDETHAEARKHKTRDFEIRKQRSANGEVWGLKGKIWDYTNDRK